MSEKVPQKGKRATAKGSRPVKAAAVKETKPKVELLPGTGSRDETSPSILPGELRPQVDPEAELLRQSRRGETLAPPRRDTPPEEVRQRQPQMERESVDHSRHVAMHAEKLRREEWQRAIAEDEARRGPNRQRNPRLPLQAAAQMFREPDISDVPDNAVVPKGHAPKWVGTHDTLSTGKESMSQIRHHQNWGYDYVRDTDGKPIVTELGVLMSASYADAARRQNHLTPKGSMKTDDSGDQLRDLAESENRRAGRHLVGVTELPDHQRRFSDRLEVE